MSKSLRVSDECFEALKEIQDNYEKKLKFRPHRVQILEMAVGKLLNLEKKNEV